MFGLASIACFKFYTPGFKRGVARKQHHVSTGLLYGLCILHSIVIILCQELLVNLTAFEQECQIISFGLEVKYISPWAKFTTHFYELPPPFTRELLFGPV